MTAGKTHPMPLVMDADAAAKRIIRALERRPGVYNFPWRMALAMKVVRWLPDWLVARAVRPSHENKVGGSGEPPTE